MQVVEFCNIWLTIIFWVLFHGFLSLSLAESKLLKSCTEAVKPAEDIPPTAALIIDGMVIVLYSIYVYINSASLPFMIRCMITSGNGDDTC